MFNKIKEFFLGKPKAQEPVAEAPYKVEAPVVPEVVSAPAPIVEEKPVKKSPAKKAPAEKTAVAKKPRTKKPAAE